MMSDRTKRPLHVYLHSGHSERCVEADESWGIVEAKRVLAEVEPNLPLTAVFCIERLQGAGREDGRGRTHRSLGCVALAEALAGFLGKGEAE